MKANAEIIEKYLNGELSPEEKNQFETELRNNELLKKQVEAQKQIMKGIESYELKNEIKNLVKTIKIIRLIRNLGIGLSVALILAFTTYYVIKKSAEKESVQKIYLQYNLNENGEAKWTDADKYLESQMYKIDPTKDTIIETLHGVIFQIPANAFKDKSGNLVTSEIDIEVKEAMTAFDIVKAGLSTTSNGKLLETGGMFYFNARSGDMSLSIDKTKPVDVHMPTNGTKQMSLFEGERTKEGTINWIKPVVMRKQLKTVDITSLDFYPPNFIDSLKALGFKTNEKYYTDSIFYSLSNMSACETADEAYDMPDTFKVAVNRTVIKPSATNVGGTVTPSGLSLIGGKYEYRPGKTTITPDGESLFLQKCASCHTTSDKKLTGPGLKNVMARVPKGDWIIDYIINSEKVLKSGDVYANKIFKENGKKSMTVFEGQLTQNDVKTIMNYVIKEGANTPVGKADTSKASCIYEINPSRIRAIWDPKFDNTILATKEFEERIKAIYSTCNPEVFNLYVNNLGKQLFEIDSMAAVMLGGNGKFLEFCARHDGGVDINSEKSVKLQNYFKAAKKMYDKAVEDALAKMYKNESKELANAETKRNGYSREMVVKQSALLKEESEVNLNEAYRQLGRQRPYVTNPSAYNSGQISNPGWHNCDRMYEYQIPGNDLVEGTLTKTTKTFKDTITGKVATIEYNETSVNVANADSYERLLCYILPDKLSSFKLMSREGSVFKDRLNKLLEPSVIVVGFKGEQAYYFEAQRASGQTISATLTEIDPGALMGKINQRYNFIAAGNIVKDIDNSLFEQKEVTRINKIKKREEIRTKLMQVVYPCANVRPATPDFAAIAK